MRKLVLTLAAITMLVSVVLFAAVSVSCASMPTEPVDGRFNVKDFGAKGNGIALDTKAIQRAVDAAGRLGDPNVEVYFPAGTYITTAIILRSNVTIHIDEGALLQASKTPAHWPVFTNVTNVEEQLNAPRFAVFYGQSLENVTLKGKGTIDGAGGYGSPYYTQPGNPEGRVPGEFVFGRRPQSIIYIRDTKNVKITGLLLRNSVRWTLVLELCNGAHIDGITIRNPPHDVGREADGIDLNTTSNVIVENCDIETGDDAICIKPQRDFFQSPPRNQYNIIIRNNVIATTCNAIKIGTGTYVDLDNVLVENIIVNRHSGRSHPDENGDTTPRSATSAISVQSNDGGSVSNLVYRNFTINDADTAMFIGLQQRRRANAYTHELGSIDGVVFENINVIRANKASQINTQPGGIVRNVTFRNITQRTTETYRHSVRPPQMTGSYPDADGFGSMPAYGLFARNVDGLFFEGVNTFIDGGNTGRPKFAFENVTNISGIAEADMPDQIDTTDYPRFPNRSPVFVETFDERSMHDREGSDRWPMDINRAPVGTWELRTVSGLRTIEKGDTPSNRFLYLNVPGASEWENYHIHAKVWPGRKDHRIPANTQISYRSIDRHERMAVAIARSNKGYIRLNRIDPYIRADGEKDSRGTQVLQLGFADVANTVQDRDMKFWDLDIVVDGPYISIYVDGNEFVRDFYDESWDDPARRRGTISIGGTPLMRFADIRVTLIEPSSLPVTSAVVSRNNIVDLPVTVNLNGNVVTKLRHGRTWLVQGTDYTINDDVVTFNRSFLQRLPAGRAEVTFFFNLGVREIPFTINVQ